jgi:hypothetical protein
MTRKAGAFVVAMATIAALVGTTAAGADMRPPATPTTPATRPGPLTTAAVARLARALGLTEAPHRQGGGWEAEDDVRSLYVTRTPSAWYVLFSNSSALLVPPPVREPGADEVTATARAVLGRAGLDTTRATAVVLDAFRTPVPCRPGLAAAADCNALAVSARPVTLALPIGRGAPPLRWGFIIGADDAVISASGRIAVPR